MVRKPAKNTTKRATAEGLPAPKPKHPNQLAAEAFAATCKLHGIEATPQQTNAIGGKVVANAWVINLQDSESEVGIGCAWFGRNHFRVWSEFVGGIGEGQAMSEAFLKFLLGCQAAHRATVGPLNDDGSPDT